MDTFKVFVLPLVIQSLAKVYADELKSSLLVSARDVRCDSSPLSFNTIGYIQCQRSCIRYSKCTVLRYSKSHMECFLFINENCWEYSGDPDSNIYMQREEIDESIGGTCLVSRCQASNVCIMLRSGARCLPDKVFTPYAYNQATAVDVDGVYFRVHPAFKTFSVARQICTSSKGKLAVLNTERKKQLVYAETKKHYARYHLWFVDATLNDFGTWLWSNGENASIQYQDNDGHCVILLTGSLYDHDCNAELSFVCEML